MNRTLVGVLLLIVLLAGGILSSQDMARWSEELAGQLDTAARQAVEDMETAVRTVRHVEERWKKKWNTNAAFADHDPMEQIDVGFAQLRVYGETGERVAFAAVCAQLAQQIRAIGEASGASWQNIL